MEQKIKNSSRKKFLLWSVAAVSSLSVLKYFFPKKNQKPNTTVKMLTQEGTLVEIDASKMYSGNREMISDKQLKNWVTKKKF